MGSQTIPRSPAFPPVLTSYKLLEIERFLLRVVDVVVHVALERAIAAGRVGVEPTARVHGKVRGLLHRLHGEIAGRLQDDRPLPTDPGDNGGPVFVMVVFQMCTLVLPPFMTWAV